MATVAEILASINELPAEEHAAFATAFQNDAGAAIKGARSKVFAAGKKEGGAGASEAAAKLTEAQERVTALEAELADVKAKTPDAAAIEKRVRDQLQPKLDAAVKERDDERAARRKDTEEMKRGDFLTALGAKQDDGSYVDPVYLEVAKVKWGDRIRVGDDGAVRVLQPGSEIAYEAADTAAALKLLATAVRKEIPADFVKSGAQGGGGRTNGTTSGAAPRAGAADDALAASKRASGAYSL